MRLILTPKWRSLSLTSRYFNLAIPNPTISGAPLGFLLTIGPITIEAWSGLTYRTGTGRHWSRKFWQMGGSIKRTPSAARPLFTWETTDAS